MFVVPSNYQAVVGNRRCVVRSLVSIFSFWGLVLPYLCTPIDLERQFKVPDVLLAFESNITIRKEAFLIQREHDIVELNNNQYSD